MLKDKYKQIYSFIKLQINSNTNLFVLIISVVLTLFLFISTDSLDYNHPDFEQPWDHHKYIYMANSLDFHIAPFCWRIMVPFLASLLPFEISINFKIIVFISLSLTGFYVFKVSKFFFNDFASQVASLFAFYSIYLLVKGPVHNFWLPDALSNFLIILGIYSILIKNNLIFISTMLIGSLTKESTLFVLPLYYTLQAKKIFDLHILKETFKVSLLPIILLLILRLIISHKNDDITYIQSLDYHLWQVHNNTFEYDIKYLLHNIALKRIENFDLRFLYRITINTFLIHFILVFFDISNTKEKIKKFYPLILLAYLQVFFAVNDQRLIVISYLPILLSSISGLKKILSIFLCDRYSLIYISFLYFLSSLVINNSLYNILVLIQLFITILYMIIKKK